MSSSGDGSEVSAGLSGLGQFLTLESSKVRFQALFFVYFIGSSGFSVFRNVYLEEMGLTGSQMGQIGFLLMAAGVVAQPAWGLLSDYFRADRTILVVGGLGSALALLSYPIGDSLAAPFALIAVGTALYSALRSPISPITTGMVLSRGFDYGSVRAFGSLAWAIGSLGFGFLVGYLGSVSIIYFYVASAGLMVAIVWSLPNDGRSEDGTGDGESEDDEPGLKEAARALITNKNFLVILAAAFLLRLSISGGEAFFAVYMRNVEVSLGLGPLVLSPDGMTGVAWTINSGIEAVAFLYVLKTNISYKWLLVGGGVIVVIPNLVYGLTTQPVILLAIQSLGGIGFAMVSVAAVDLAHEISAERVTSTAQSLLTGLGYGLGAAAGQIVAGTLLDAVGIMDMYVGISVLGFLGAAVGLLVSTDSRSGKPRQTAGT
ncbi:MFS transporter [Halapricum hydrolyticum]|uniref:MFS transporter n=1 Tax=Halapricum hydrolyticum TaxID=2979991 RepID=A0AAE3LE75_9EURY|nr:MFS transporter [Halapricum hydrolyticum]MCU4719659.1 MFS transporter [Halapricum hydrolyticum]MCU4725957.1 MFS transporter [Halapricum hydrolyticum]